MIFCAGPWSLDSGGASVIVTVGNPILSEFHRCKYDLGNAKGKMKMTSIEIINKITKEIKENIQTEYLEKIISSYLINKQNNYKSFKMKDFLYKEGKYPPGRNTIENIINNDDIHGLLGKINEDFSISTGIPLIRF